jgi:hypothetical protein
MGKRRNLSVEAGCLLFETDSGEYKSFTMNFKQLFCRHEWESIIGTAVYAGKKNHSELYIYPVEKKVCRKCGREKFMCGGEK